MSFSQHWSDHVLQELFDTPAPKVDWKWNSGYAAWEATVVIGDTSYGLMMSSFPWELGKWNIPAFDASTWSQLRHGCWCFEFYEQRADGSQHHDVTGTAMNRSSKVFGVMGAAVLKLVRDNPKLFKHICFGGKEANRISLYEKLAPRLAEKMNKQLFKNDKGDHFFLVDRSISIRNEGVVASAGHLMLDIAGLIPGAGEYADIANTLWYCAERQYLKAALSLVSCVPVLGDIIGKGTKLGMFLSKAGKHITKVKTLIKSNKRNIDVVFDKASKHKKLAPHVDGMREALHVFAK